MQPMLVVCLLKLLVESGSAEAVIDGLKVSENPCKQFFKCEWGKIGIEEGVERGSWCCVRGIEADSNYKVIIS